ncbi:metal-binding protein [Methanococcoides methylutens]|uniref:Metal-binding protein n=1 Tax=Methanococcoides methylutens TaxID=2226 RepID=A0A099T046_METMT|nr:MULTISPECIES: UPF0058 family protein [Methanococcoides]KGK98525.1 metal-binding protein [Methanococcoides methylutens]UGV40427.1 UPF0058 family protein [Methanococcoides orientis]
MHKDELIQLHTLLAQIKRHLETQDTDHDFSEYQSLAISPVHIHRSKAEHKHAIFVLGNHLASIMSEDELSGIGRTSTRMQEFAKRTSRNVSGSNN